ncbi:RepB family DNA primase [Bradyrhizobium barranii subsp. barranii]|uniref:RepB family DNA primase n=1 Tax=Bradyrhizobium barranii subsp. barranii TaxID=2823807 RepID=A0A7Z0Q9M1_9BRAD|nr:DUF5906 domain-containing protein [Bradyrhizobium barranii]UGX93637.1 RepB family DNA primase [Bradyrhizobium barranii subsp. barranii]
MTETVSPDFEASFDFLKKMYPSGRWVLTAIRPDRKGIDTQTFGPDNEGACKSWLRKYAGRWNIYWSVNPPLRDLSKKAEREDIKEVVYLHVDVDPRAGEDLKAERERLEALFSTKLPSTVLVPTAVLFSGGGYQAFWRLEIPIPVNGDLQLAEDAKRYNQQLELIFGGDNCHNIDRIMRLPGTINVPDEKKRKKGRTQQLAILVSYTDATYPLGKFTPAPSVAAPDIKGFTGGQHTTVRVSDNIARIEDINELDKWDVPDRVKVICVQGKHPEEPKEGDNSRSMWVFDCCCQLARCGVPDDVIFSILTDPDLGISESILEKGGSAEKYAIRQIERAKEEVEEPWLRKLNETHFVVANHGGDCVVAVFDRENGDGLPQLSYQTFGAFRGRYCNIDIETSTDKKGKAVTTELGKWWLKHKSRREYLGVIFRAGREEVLNGYYNLWQGFGIDPRPGDWSLMQKHIGETLAGEHEASAQYILNWAAWALQNPEKPAEAALVFRGGHGVGKGVFARSLVQLFGCHGKQVNAPSQFAGKFNAHLRNVCLLFADEALVPNDPQSLSIIKGLLTEPQLQIEGKGKDLVQAINHVKVIMASNERWVAPVQNGDRRFAVFDVSDKYKNQQEYFDKLYAQMADGGLQAMLHDLQNRELGDWHPRRIVETQARNDQKNASLAGFERIWLDILRTGELPEPTNSETARLRQMDEQHPRLSTSELKDYAQKYALPGEKITTTEIGLLFNELGYRKIEDSRPRCYQVPTLAEARGGWDVKRAPERWDSTGCWSLSGRTPNNDVGPF